MLRDTRYIEAERSSASQTSDELVERPEPPIPENPAEVVVHHQDNS
jgi:hypothetical protein